MSESVERDLQSSDSDLPDTLYHYTDIYGLAGIWEKGQIWATNSMYLNDTSEVRLGIRVAQNLMADRQIELLNSITEVWDRQLAQSKKEAAAGAPVPDSEAFDRERAVFEPELAELKAIRAALDESLEVENSTTYIACLTEHGDQLSQWRGYAREGYCVGLDTKMLLDSLGDERVMRRVQYYDESTSEVFGSRVLEIAMSYRKALMDMDTELDIDFLNYVTAKYSLIEAAFMKDSNFREEGEVRIVELSSDPDLFTPHRYGMVPRRTIPIPAGAVRSVRVGPSAHKDLKHVSLIRYFWKVGFGGNPLPPAAERVRPSVFVSTIPFRDW